MISDKIAAIDGQADKYWEKHLLDVERIYWTIIDNVGHCYGHVDVKSKI